MGVNEAAVKYVIGNKNGALMLEMGSMLSRT